MKKSIGPWHVKESDNRLAYRHFSLCDERGTHAHSLSRESLMELADQLNAASFMYSKLQQIERLSREAVRSELDVASMLGDIADQAIYAVDREK